ncbi:hypothetical protein K470DRAFT_207422, partial [Piedraia hortae CBS 480.64]
ASSMTEAATMEIHNHTRVSSASSNAGSASAGTSVCVICASDITHYSVGICNHRTCHVCALRLRTLYENKTCAYCRMETEVLIFTKDASKKFEDYITADIYQTDNNLGICYENVGAYISTTQLLRFKCPHANCEAACKGWKELARHVQSVHKKKLCELCTKHKKVFVHEHELFTDAELQEHRCYGDDKPRGTADEKGFQGHPFCKFCSCRFYDDQALFNHCREHHDICPLCKECPVAKDPVYLIDSAALERHFREDHWPCQEQPCIEKRFIAFGTEDDLRKHEAEEH